MKTQNTDKATARPWHAAHNAEVADTIHSGAGQVAQMSNGAMDNLGADVREANAALIVKAVNERDSLKSFVESIAKMDVDYADKAVLESMVATAKQLTQAT